MSEHEHEHVHEHTHEHTHADGTTHSHPHEHGHVHGHTHDHGDGHAHTHEHLHAEGEPHTHEHGAAAAQPMDQLYALMKYMAGHNADHTRELEELAAKARDAGNAEGCDLIMEAVRFFDQGNEALSKALEKFAPAQ